MNTSVVANNINDVNLLNENGKYITPCMSLESIAMDVGRGNFNKKAASRYGAFVIFFFLLVNSFGGQILKSELDVEGLLNTTDWSVADNDPNMVAMFSNFDNLYDAIERLLSV